MPIFCEPWPGKTTENIYFFYNINSCIKTIIIVYQFFLYIKFIMNNYEHTIIARQDTSASQIKQIKEKYSDIILKNKGNIVQTQDWGLMNLSYLIKKNKKGNYIHFKIKCDGSLIKELEKNEKLDKNLLRFLTVKLKNLILKLTIF